MNTLGVRALMQSPSLPRITSQDPPASADGGDSARSMPRRTVQQAERGLPAWKGGPPSPPPVTKQPGRFVTELVTKRPGCFVTAQASPSTRRGSGPATAAARIVDPAIASRLRQGTVVRLTLGEFVIELVLRDSRLYGKVLAESASAKDLIESHLDDLRRGLERRGIEIGGFEVTVAGPEPAPSEELPLRSVRRLVLDVLA
jgi:hypothetical protein